MAEISNIKDTIIKKLGGVGAVARICGITAGAVSQWEIIPARHQIPLLQAAIQEGLDVKPDDFIPVVKSKKTKTRTQ